ncbi:hypothetical protein HYV11_03110 [Candidatus Dependentiae bacterium]|nr:hypothetical protein [Candidatus Dependentiae bacterium]
MKKILSLAFAVLLLGKAVDAVGIKEIPGKVVSGFKDCAGVVASGCQTGVKAVETKIATHPKMAILVIAAATLVAEQAIIAAYNKFVASEETDEEENFDIA